MVPPLCPEALLLPRLLKKPNPCFFFFFFCTFSLSSRIHYTSYTTTTIHIRPPFSKAPSSADHHQVSAFASSLRLCAQEKALLRGRDIHSLLVSRGFERNKLLSNLLLYMYGCCASLQDAYHLFEKMSAFRDKFSWNFIISSHTRHGFFREAFQLFHRMLLEEVVTLDGFILASILAACAEMKDLTTGRHVHILIVVYFLPLDVVLVNAIINMYVKCAHLEDASFVLDGMNEKMEATWNAVISGYVQNEEAQKAITYYLQMMMEVALPNNVTFISVISACTDRTLLYQGKQMHARLSCTGGANRLDDDLVLVNTLINMYGKCGELRTARDLFDEMPYRSNLVSWNAMIVSYIKHNDGNHAFHLFHHLNQEGVLANRATFRTLLPILDHADLKQSKRLHVQIVNYDGGGEFGETDDNIASNLIYMYSKCGSFHDAHNIFEIFEHNLLTWNAIISAHSCQHAVMTIPALHFFHQMLQEGILPYMTCTFVNVILGCANRKTLTEGKIVHALLVGSKKDSEVTVETALLNMYGKCGYIEDAYMIFSGMSERNESSWTAMIAAYAEQGYAKEAMLLFERMQWEGMGVDKAAILCILSACSNQLALSHAKRAHSYVLETRFGKDPMVQNALVTMYSKCSSLHDARKVFDMLSMRNLVSWTAQIAACAQHGQGDEAFSHFQHLLNEGHVLDKVAYAEILVACSHCGLIEEAIHVFCCIKHQDNISVTVDHYNCLIDLFTRLGRLEFAEHIISNMPLSANAVSWLTILGGCQAQHDLERGERAAKRAHDLSPKGSTSFVTLSNLYAQSGRFDDAAYLMNQMWLLGQRQLTPVHT